MRAAIPAISALALALIGLGVFAGGQAARKSDAPAAGAAGTEPAPALPAAPAPGPKLPGLPAAASRQIAPGVVAPPELDPGELQRTAPRAPLSELSGPLPPREEERGGILFRPLAVESAVVEAMGRTVTIAGTESLAADETCEFEGRPWACGMRARTAFRMWLRGRALDCGLPPDAGDDVTAPCRLGKQDAGEWLVSNGWARAAPGGPYAGAEAEARAAGKGIFGPPPELADPPLAEGTTASTATPPADQPEPAQ